MHKLGFDVKLIKLIMQCVKTVYFSILINEEPKGLITPTRGLRQEDPPSPYLFLLCIQGLISLMKRVANSQFVVGIKICRGAPLINHLLFANDIVIFCKVDTDTNMRV